VVLYPRRGATINLPEINCPRGSKCVCGQICSIIPDHQPHQIEQFYFSINSFHTSLALAIDNPIIKWADARRVCLLYIWMVERSGRKWANFSFVCVKKDFVLVYHFNASLSLFLSPQKFMHWRSLIQFIWSFFYFYKSHTKHLINSQEAKEHAFAFSTKRHIK
jgi:hypothetical protein